MRLRVRICNISRDAKALTVKEARTLYAVYSGCFHKYARRYGVGGREARARRLLAEYWRPARLRAHHPLPLAGGQLNTAPPAAYPRRIDGKLLNTRHPLRYNATANPHLVTTPNCILKTMLRTHHSS